MAHGGFYLVDLRAVDVPGNSAFEGRRLGRRAQRQHRRLALGQLTDQARPRGSAGIRGVLPHFADRGVARIAAPDLEDVVALTDFSDIGAGSARARIDAGLRRGATRLPGRTIVGKSGAVAGATLASGARADLTRLTGRAAAADPGRGNSQRDVQRLRPHSRPLSAGKGGDVAAVDIGEVIASEPTPFLDTDAERVARIAAPVRQQVGARLFADAIDSRGWIDDCPEQKVARRLRVAHRPVHRLFALHTLASQSLCAHRDLGDDRNVFEGAGPPWLFGCQRQLGEDVALLVLAHRLVVSHVVLVVRRRVALGGRRTRA